MKQLRERLRETEDRVEAAVRERVKEREQQLARQLADREAQAQERESDLLQQLNDGKHQNTTLAHGAHTSGSHWHFSSFITQLASVVESTDWMRIRNSSPSSELLFM